MIASVILDTGPFVAAVDRRDRWHEWAREQLGGIRPPLVTCEAVLAETLFLLKNVADGRHSVIRMIERGVVELAFHADQQFSAISRLLVRYESVPMAFADACLVRMAELRDTSSVLTLDADFRIYRKHGRQIVPTIMPG